MTKHDFLESIKGADRQAIKENYGSFNEWLVNGYKHQTGCNDFRTFKQWKDAGFKVKKGASSYPVFSRPISVLKSIKGQEVNDQDCKLFGVCHLFNESQVERAEP